MDADDGVLGFTTAWVNSLARQCESVTVITNEVGALRVEPNVTVHSVGRELGRGRLAKTVAFYAILWRVLRTRRIDVCFAHMTFIFPLMAAPFLKLFGVPIVLWYAHAVTPPLYRLTTHVVQRIVTSSTSFGLKDPKLKVLSQGIDTDRFTPAGPRAGGDEVRLLTLGRISRVKRNHLVIEAMARLRETAPHLRLRCDLVGDPMTDDCRVYLEELKALCAERALEGVVRLRPGVPFAEAAAVMREADIFVNSTDNAFDKALLEALSCGLPVVTSNAAFADILPPALRIGIVPKDDAGALAAAIRALAEMAPAARQALGAQGRAFVVEHHSLAGLTRRLMVEFRALAPHANSGGSVLSPEGA